MRSNITKIVCDYVKKDGTPCDKAFLLPDPPDLPTEGNENIVSVTLILNGTPTTLYFCCRLHSIAYLTELEKLEKTAPPQPKKTTASKTGFSESQFRTLQDMGILVAAPESRAHMAMEEIESIPPAPDNLRIE